MTSPLRKKHPITAPSATATKGNSLGSHRPITARAQLLGLLRGTAKAAVAAGALLLSQAAWAADAPLPSPAPAKATALKWRPARPPAMHVERGAVRQVQHIEPQFLPSVKAGAISRENANDGPRIVPAQMVESRSGVPLRTAARLQAAQPNPFGANPSPAVPPANTRPNPLIPDPLGTPAESPPLNTPETNPAAPRTNLDPANPLLDPPAANPLSPTPPAAIPPVREADPLMDPLQYPPRNDDPKGASDQTAEDCETGKQYLKNNTLDQSRGMKILNLAPPNKGEMPYECLIEGGIIHGGERSWSCITYTWKASALCHKPLYFEQVSAERYGHSWGPVLDPVVGTAHFFGTIPLLPYMMGVDPICECQYPLGYYRPGNCAPYMIEPFPLSGRGAAMQAGAAAGLIYALP